MNVQFDASSSGIKFSATDNEGGMSAFMAAVKQSFQDFFRGIPDRFREGCKKLQEVKAKVMEKSPAGQELRLKIAVVSLVSAIAIAAIAIAWTFLPLFFAMLGTIAGVTAITFAILSALDKSPQQDTQPIQQQ